jgi:hypothetical protein
MSLTIKLEKVYKKLEENENQRSKYLAEHVALAVGGTKETNALLLSKEAFLECRCIVKFRQTKQERVLTRANCARANFVTAPLASAPANDTTDFHDMYDDDEKERNKLLRKTNESVDFVLASHLRNDELLEIECFKRDRFKKR